MSLSTLPRLVQALTCEPLAVEKNFLHAFVNLVRRHNLEGMSFNGAEIHSELEVAHPRSGRKVKEERRVAVIPIVGVIANRAQSMGAGADSIGQAIDAAAADRHVDAIVLDIDSPGGTITGVPELAEKVLRARQAKPVVSVANGMMASAAYWVGAAAGEVVVAPSSQTGSIGVFMLHEDWTEAMEKEGVKITEISAGKYKTEGAPWKELDSDGEAHIRDQVEHAYAWFVRDVARFRNVTSSAVKNGYGEGRVLDAKEAVKAGLADRVGTLEETIQRLASGASVRRGVRASVDHEVRSRKRARGVA